MYKRKEIIQSVTALDAESNSYAYIKDNKNYMGNVSDQRMIL